jgi:tRNA modification GTPase
VAATSSPILNQARHVAALIDASAALSAAIDAPLPELRAEDLRLSMRALGRITGDVDVEGILDLVFGNFCIGK